jgi:transcriptional regulator GlxA family with amidase domain
VLDAAEALTGTDPRNFRFLSMVPVSPALDAYWRSTVALVHAQLHTPGVTHYHPLVAAETYALLVRSVLQTFPNTTMTGLRRPGAGPVAAAVVRQAMAFIRANADEPLTLAEIAATVGVRPRGLQHAFRRHADISPTDYLRSVRLQHAHEELRAADPAAGVTVAAVAARHGFGDLGLFRRRYRKAYRCTPAETLAG